MGKKKINSGVVLAVEPVLEAIGNAACRNWTVLVLKFPWWQRHG
jgi:RNase P/RNase MRP subunit p30